MSDLLWKEFDKQHIDFPDDNFDEYKAKLHKFDTQYEIGMERFNPMRFVREYEVFRIGHLSPGRIIELGSKLELPTGSILHIADNFKHEDDTQDLPRIDECEFIARESFRKYIHHIRELNLDGPIQIDDKYIIRWSGLPSILMKFRSQQGTNFKYINTIAEFPAKKECLVVVNHNPLFRVRVYGQLQFFRRMQIILASIFNTVAKLTNQNKQQFIFLPWGEEVFNKQLFVRNRQVLNRATVKYPENFHYILMMHLMNFMWNDATTSIFDKLSEDTLAQTNIILNLNNKYLFYNLKMLRDLNEKNKAYYRFVNQLNMLSVLGRIEETTPALEEELRQDYDVVEEADTSAVTKVYGIKEVDLPPEDTDTSTGPSEEDTRVEAVVAKTDKIIPKSVFKPTTQISHNIPQVTQVLKDTNITTNGALKGIQQNTTQIVTTNSNTDIYADTYVEEMEKEAEQLIDAQSHLSPKEKGRYKAISHRWKNIEFEGERLESILRGYTDMSLDDSTISEDQVGELPDKSALKSSIVNFDRSYMEKSFKKDLVGIITSFQKQGAYLVDLKTKKTINRMSNITEYSCKFIDIQGKESTVKFRMPNVDKEGRVKIDGVTQILKKQRVNLPIVKISDIEVSLASNYNKTRVIRNQNKAHNFFAYVDSIINTPKSTAILDYGKCIVNLPLSYEYSSIAERYRSVSFGKWHFFFDFNERSEHFNDTSEKMLELEAQYGTYCGTYADDWLFIDNQNVVRAVKQTGGEDVEFPYSNLIDIFKLSLKEGESAPNKHLSEWVTIKILDKNLPVIFLLAYRYGLRNILDYLKIPYVITEGRTKTIVGESGQADYEVIPTTESFGANIDVVAGDPNPFGDDWIKLNDGSCSIDEAVDYVKELADTELPGLEAFGFWKQLAHWFLKPTVFLRKWLLSIFGKKNVTVFWKTTIYGTKIARGKYRINAITATLLTAPTKSVRRLVPGFEGKVIDKDKVFKGPICQSIAKYLHIHERNIAFADFKKAKPNVLMKVRLLKPISMNEIQAISKQPSVLDETRKKMAMHQQIPGLSDFEAGMEDFNIYHLAENIDTVKKYGLCSPRAMYEIDKNLFMKYSYPNYEERAKEYKNKENVTPEDVLDFLDNSPDRVPSSSRCLFFSFLSNEEMPHIKSKEWELEISIDTIRKYSLGDPILFLGRKRTQVPWEDFIKNLELYKKKALAGTKTPVTKFLYKYILHFAVDCKPIPFAEMKAYRSSMFDPNQYLDFSISANIPTPDVNKINHLDQLRSLDLDPDEFIIGGSSSLVAWGLKDSNNDIDVFVTKECRERLQKNDQIEIIHESASGLDIYHIKDTDLDLGPVDVSLMDIDDLKDLGICIVDGIRILNIYGCMKFYDFMLKHSPSEYHTAKWTKTVQHINEEVSKWFNHTVYHSSPISGLTSIDPKKDKTPEGVNLPYIYASYWPYFSIFFGAVWNDSQANLSWTVGEDGVTPHFTFTNKSLTKEQLHVPCSIYQLGDESFQHLFTENIQHPIFELVSSANTAVKKEVKISDWFDTLKAMEQQGIVNLVGFEEEKSLVKSAIQTNIPTADGEEIKRMEFPEDEIEQLSTQDRITTTRVSLDFDAFQKGDTVITPWGDYYLVQDRQEFTKVTDHPNYNELTEEQKEFIAKFDQYAVLTLLRLDVSSGISDLQKYTPKSGDIPIKFADRVLWINRYPLPLSLIVAGLESFDCTKYNMSEFEDKDVYYDLLLSKGLSINYLKGIDDWFDLFMDIKTYQVLKMMHEPTNIRDLLIRCAVLLSTLDHRNASSRENFRIRGYEQFNDILYNEMSRQLAAYRNKRGRGNVFSINPDAVYLRIIQNASMVPAEDGNPIQDLKETCAMTYAGVGGRTSESFVVNDRKFSKDDVGVISEATVDNYKVGINAYLTVDPGITNTLGILQPKKLEELSPANVLSSTAALFPFSMNDDMRRVNSMLH